MNLKNSLKLVRSVVLNIPTPTSISYFWNFGSLLGLCLLVQIMTGIFLSFQYESSLSHSFSSVMSIMLDVNFGWVVRFIHANGASFFFVCVYCHLFRGIYYGSYVFPLVWVTGVVILLMLMMTAFLGYVLPWGQMSFWGATVITNLISTVPYLGLDLVEWLWGGFSVSKPTLIRFFSLHFLLPFLVLILVFSHIIFIHTNGSSNPLGLSLNSDKINFSPFFIVKDILGFVVFGVVLFLLVTLNPSIFLDPENSIPANPLSTPPHIQPEWYFLFAYAILRSVPSKLGGVVGLLMSILILLYLIFSKSEKGVRFNPLKKLFFWVQFLNFITLTWLGMMPVEHPFVLMGQIISFLYFGLFFLL